MFDEYRPTQYRAYNAARTFFISNTDILIHLEKFITKEVLRILIDAKDEIERDYNEASYLYPFWQNYPPEDRGRAPRGDQYPWIEIGEHVIGAKLSRMLPKAFDVMDCGIPTGPDERFILSSKEIENICNGFTNSCWLFTDIKSVGPRDDQPHAVMSHNQISGNGLWTNLDDGVYNSVIRAEGLRATHDFYCAMPPLYVTSTGLILPTVQVAIKPVYEMLHLSNGTNVGQPIERIEVFTIPNGLLLFEGPKYLENYPGLFYPGKDDSKKKAEKCRARVSFSLLDKIDKWRVNVIRF